MAFRDIGPLALQAAQQDAAYRMEKFRIDNAIREARRAQTMDMANRAVAMRQQKKAERKARKDRNVGIAASVVGGLVTGGLLSGLGAAPAAATGTGIVEGGLGPGGLTATGLAGLSPEITSLSLGGGLSTAGGAGFSTGLGAAGGSGLGGAIGGALGNIGSGLANAGSAAAGSIKDSWSASGNTGGILGDLIRSWMSNSSSGGGKSKEDSEEKKQEKSKIIESILGGLFSAPESA